MTEKSLIPLLEQEWQQPEGFLGKLRLGIWDPVGLKRLVQVLQSVEVKSAVVLNRRFVSLVWFIPLFMVWQREQFQRRGKDVEHMGTAIAQVEGLVMEILGVP